LRRRPKTEVLLEGSRKRFGSEFHIDGLAQVLELSVDGWLGTEETEPNKKLNTQKRSGLS